MRLLYQYGHVCNIASMGVTGRPVPCRNRHNTPDMFYAPSDATAERCRGRKAKGQKLAARCDW